MDYRSPYGQSSEDVPAEPFDRKMFESIFGQISGNKYPHPQDFHERRKNPLYQNPGSSMDLYGTMKGQQLRNGFSMHPDGYENMFKVFNKTFGPKGTMWLRDNVDYMTPEQIQRIMRWVQFSEGGHDDE